MVGLIPPDRQEPYKGEPQKVKSEENKVEGKKLDGGKLNYALVPWKAMDEVVKVLMFGAAKYSVDNWKKVEDAKRRYLSAAYRHLNAVSEGEWLDSESGLPHAAHAVCCLIFILWFGEDVKDCEKKESPSCEKRHGFEW